MALEQDSKVLFVPYKYSDSALQEKVRNSCGNRAVNKRIYEKSLDGAETISFGGTRCGYKVKPKYALNEYSIARFSQSMLVPSRHRVSSI